MRVPETICLYAVCYCSRYRLSNGSESRDCSSREALRSDPIARLQVALTVLYATSAGMACFATVMHLTCCLRSLRTSTLWTSASLWIALVFVSVASLVVAIIFCVVHMVVLVLTKNLPLAAVHLDIGSRYLALTWASVAGMILALSGWRSWDQHTVSVSRHQKQLSLVRHVLMLFSDSKCCPRLPATTLVVRYNAHNEPTYEGQLSGSGNGVEHARGLGERCGRVVRWLGVGACE
jgi:hypothetical protein